MPKSKLPEVKTVAENRKAFHDYEILEKMEAGIVLIGDEVKSIRGGLANLKGSFITVLNAVILAAELSSTQNPSPRSDHAHQH